MEAGREVGMNIGGDNQPSACVSWEVIESKLGPSQWFLLRPPNPSSCPCVLPNYLSLREVDIKDTGTVISAMKLGYLHF